MRKMIWDTLKVFVIFAACTCLFYVGLRFMHAEYEKEHRYDLPEGPSVKVFYEVEDMIDRLDIFFRLGE